MNYRKGGDKVRKAWLDYVKTVEYGTSSSCSFVAGWMRRLEAMAVAETANDQLEDESDENDKQVCEECGEDFKHHDIHHYHGKWLCPSCLDDEKGYWKFRVDKDGNH